MRLFEGMGVRKSPYFLSISTLCLLVTCHVSFVLSEDLPTEVKEDAFPGVPHSGNPIRPVDLQGVVNKTETERQTNGPVKNKRKSLQSNFEPIAPVEQNVTTEVILNGTEPKIWKKKTNLNRTKIHKLKKNFNPSEERKGKKYLSSDKLKAEIDEAASVPAEKFPSVSSEDAEELNLNAGRGEDVPVVEDPSASEVPKRFGTEKDVITDSNEAKDVERRMSNWGVQKSSSKNSKTRKMTLTTTSTTTTTTTTANTTTSTTTANTTTTTATKRPFPFDFNVAERYKEYTVVSNPIGPLEVFKDDEGGIKFYLRESERRVKVRDSGVRRKGRGRRGRQGRRGRGGRRRHGVQKMSANGTTPESRVSTPVDGFANSTLYGGCSLEFPECLAPLKCLSGNNGVKKGEARFAADDLEMDGAMVDTEANGEMDGVNGQCVCPTDSHAEFISRKNKLSGKIEYAVACGLGPGETCEKSEQCASQRCREDTRHCEFILPVSGLFFIDSFYATVNHAPSTLSPCLSLMSLVLFEIMGIRMLSYVYSV